MLRNMLSKYLLVIGCFVMQLSYADSTTLNDDLLRGGQNPYQKKFSNVLLVINFNHPHYNNIEFLRKLYSSAFEHIVFYGEKEHPEVYSLTTSIGFFLSGVIQDAMQRFPDYQGYLFLQDDCVLNFWNYVSYDFEKIWFAVKFNDGNHQNNKFYNIINVSSPNAGAGQGWGHWVLPHGCRAVWNARAHMDNSEINMLHMNVGHNNIPCMMCEVFYIPSRFRESALRLSSILQNVFCEIAVPTMLCCLDSISNWEQLKMLGGEGLGYAGINSPVLRPYPVGVNWIHPLKFSQQHNRDGIAAIFNAMLAS